MANKGQWRAQTRQASVKAGAKANTNNNRNKNKKKKKQAQQKPVENDRIVSKKQRSEQNRAKAEKTGANKLRATSNQHANERRSGAIRAQNSTVGKATRGAVEYVAQKHAQQVTKAYTSANKRAAETAGHGNRGKSGQVHAPTRSVDRANQGQVSRSEQYRANEKKNKAQEKAVKKSDYKGNAAVAAGRSATKKLGEANKKSLEMGASGFSDKKHKIKAPIVGEVEFSNQDIYKGSVKAGNEMLDYVVPYGGSAKGAIKAADAMVKAGKAAKAGKVLTEIGEKGGKQLSESGMKVVKGIAQKAAKEGKKADLEALQKRILKSDLKDNIKRELLANAMQDVTIGTGIDLAKGMEEGYTGKDLAKYMGENALMNVAMGAPISAIAGRTGKAGKQAIAKDIKGTFNKQFASANKFTDAQRKELVALEAREGFGINTPEQTARLNELRDKAITNRAGVAQIDSKGKLIANNNGIVTDVMSKNDVREYAHLQAKYETGTLKNSEAARLRELATNVGNAYEAVQRNATMAVDAVKRGANVNLDNMDSAVNFYRRTGEEKKVNEAIKARTETAMRQFNTDRTTAKFITSTVDRSNGDIMIRPINGDDAKQLLGLPEDKIIDGFTKTTNGKKYVFINPKSTRGTSITLAHELTHHAIDDFGKFIDTMKTYAKGDFDVKKGEIREPYEQQGLTDAEIDEEVSCDLMAEYIDKQKTEYFAHLMGEDKTVFQKMRNYIKKIVSGDPDYSKDKKFKELSQMFDDAYHGNIGAKGVEGEKYAIRNLPPDAGKSERRLLERYEAALKNGDKEHADIFDGTLKRYEKHRKAARNTFVRAKTLQVELDDAIADVAKNLGFEHTALKSGKSTDSMLSKVADRQWADSVEKLNDLYRHKVQMNSFGDTKKTTETVFEKLRSQGFKVLDAEVKDNKKSGYKGLHITVEKNGLGGEIQLTTAEHWKFKEKSDAIYDSIRELDERSSRGEKLTPEEHKELLDGYDKSIKLWNEFDSKEFYEAADAFREARKGLQSQRGGSTASPTSEAETGLDGSTHSPSTSSSKSFLSDENRTVRPSSNSTGRPSKSDNSAISNPLKKSGDIIPEKGGKDKAKMALSANKQTIVAGKGSANEVLSLSVIKSKLHGVNKNNPALLKKIRKDTGWYKDSDGNWKFDIDVSNMKLKNGINNLVKKGDMGGIINEEVDGIEAFFKNFPDVGDASIKFADIGDKPYELTTSKSGKMLYGIVLNSQLAKKNSDMFKASGLAKPNILVNDTLSDALQDIVKKMDEGTLNGQNPDYIDGDLFDIEAIRKLANQSQKPVFKEKIGSAKDLDDTINAVKNKKKPTKEELQKSYEDFKERAAQKWDAMSDTELDKEIKMFNFTRDGKNFKEVSEKYKQVMLNNGSLLPTKDAVKAQYDAEDFALDWIKTKKDKSLVDIFYDVNEDATSHDLIEYMYDDSGGDRIYHAAKIAYTAEICDCSYKEAANIVRAVYEYTGSSSAPGSYGKDIEDLLNKYVDNAPAYLMDEGQVLYHGVGTNSLWKLDAIEKIWDEHGAGAVLAADVHPNAKKKGSEGAASSWSTSEHAAHGFTGGQYVIWVRCHNCISGTSITHLSYFDTSEWEVLFGTHSQWTMINFERGTYNGKDCAYVDVVERAENAPEPDVKFALSQTLGESKESMVAAPSAKAHALEKLYDTKVDGVKVFDKKGKITKDAEANYAKLAEAGDAENAQEYVNAVLESKGYTVDAYHGSDTAGFTKYDAKKTGTKHRLGGEEKKFSDSGVVVFSARTKETAGTYTSNPTVVDVADMNGDGGIYHGKLRMENPFVVETGGKEADWLPTDSRMMTAKEWREANDARGRIGDLMKEYYNGTYRSYSVEDFIQKGESSVFKSFDEYKLAMEKQGALTSNVADIVKYAKDNGYDGVVLKDTRDYGGRNMRAVKSKDRSIIYDDERDFVTDDIYAVFSSEQFKSADPFTYRDDGSLIPLSERGNEKNPDIRFALSSAETKGGETVENYEKALKNATTDEERKAIQAEIDKLNNGKQAQKAEVSNEPELTRPLDVKGIIQRTRRTKTADPKYFNESAKRSVREAEEKYGGSKEFNDLVTGYGEAGKLGKYKMQAKEDALANAHAELADVGYEDMLKEYYKAGFDEDPNVMQARANVLLNEIDRLNDAGEIPDNVALAEKLNIMSKDSSSTGFASKVLLAKKEWLTSTPQGRLITVQREIEQLEKRYKDRIKGGKLKIDDAKLEELANATGSRKDELLDEINKELWEQIPASLMERLNEYRHCFMLFNVKTHGRNIAGNSFFRLARAVSDWGEQKILNSGVARRKIGKLQGKDASEVIIDKQKVTGKEIKDNIGILENEFHAIYDKSGSRNKYIEMGRPDGVPTVKFKPMQKLIDLNYAALEKEDLKGALKPAFNKAYIGYCKARCPKDTALYDFMKNMTPAQKEKARHYAMTEGEYATFRDSCAFSDWLIGKKQTFAGKEAKTKWGTFGYRALDAVLEGAIPFVKTPVNIFRRSVDFSPASVVFSLGKLANAKSADEFMYGVHQLCTGLTGTGMAGLGVFLASQGLITVKAGEESGDAYMDRDMGYQDYSLKLRLGDKETSWTLDWMSPMGMSLFGGAAFQKCLAQDGWDNQSVLNMFYACTSPMTDMSFMSSPKDTMERFLENATRGSGDKETDFGGALAQLIVGDMPKNYVSGFFPQLMAQAAGATDEYQRDTRSTAENIYIKGWESSAKQLANKVPVLREYLLNPKINRRGEDVKTGDNIAIRICNSFFNPSNVKEINENETDRELIKIRNHMDKGTDDYRYFYYNLTGSPNYNLANGKRMTYDEAYTYGKSSRIKQNKMIETMIHADSYKNMTWKMRADEVDDTHWVGNAVADLKTYGANYAVKALCKDNEKEKEVLNTYRQLNGRGEQTNKNFMRYYIDKETLLTRSHATGDDTYRIKGVVALRSGDKNLLSALDIHKSKVTDLKNYIKAVKSEGGTKAQISDKIFKELSDGCCNIMAESNKGEVSNPSKGIKSIAAGVCAARGEQIPERVYRAFGHNWNSAQAGGGLQLKYNKDGKYDVSKISEMKTYLRTLGDKDESGSVNKAEVIDYINNTLKITNKDEAACLYEVLYNGGRYKNPYKSQIDDHLKWRENHDDDWGTGTGGGGGRGGWGRRGHGWGHGGGGGSGKGKAPSTDTGAISGKVSNPFSTSNGSSPSNLNDAYRKKARKLSEKMN